MASVTSDLGRSDLTPEVSSVWSQTFEGDGIYSPYASTEENPGLISAGVRDIVGEHFVWIGAGASSTSEREFNLPGFRAVLGLTLRLQGVDAGAHGLPRVYFGPVGGQAVELPGELEVPPLARRIFSFDGGALAGLPIQASRNRVIMELGEGVSGTALDRMRWTYERSFAATGDQIDFRTTPAMIGPREFLLTGFNEPPADPALLAYDVTDSLAPKIVGYSPAQLQSGGRALRLQFDLSDSRSFAITRPYSAAVPVSIAKEGDEDLASVGDEDVIVVTAPEFAAGLEPWVAKRESQGFKVKVVSVRDLFDQFNGGRAWPNAIRSYLRYLFRSREVAPSYLLLVGDASDDFANVLTGVSAPNFVPTQTLFSNVLGVLVGTDFWYVDNLEDDTEDLDFRPDMHLGRLPVGSTSELATMVDKIIRYEDWSPNDNWRNRGLFVSDDEYSNSIGFGGTYQWQGSPRRDSNDGENIFIYASRKSRDIIQRQAGFADFECDSFFVAQYMDSVACLGRCRPDSNGSGDCRDWRCPMENNDLTTRVTGGLCYPPGTECPASCPATCDNLEFGQNIVAPRLLTEMSRGHLFVTYNGHANGQLCAHEYILREEPSVYRFDSEHMENVGKPFIFMGYGCHLAEFSKFTEAATFEGDALGERMLLQPDGRAAIAAFASTAYEWRNENDLLNLALFRSWFLNPPQDANGNTQWRLGDLITGAKLELLAQSANRDNLGMMVTYNLLGDPTLTIDIAPPRLAEVKVNGDLWDGNALVAAAESDSAEIEVLLTDETMIGSVTVTDREGVIDPSRYELIPDPTRPNDDRRRVLRYNSLLVTPPEDYEVRITARDRTGRDRSLALPVKLETKLFALEQGVYHEISPGGFVAAGDSIRIELSNPIDLAASELTVALNEDRIEDAVATPREAGNDREWIVRARLPQVSNLEGNSIRLRIDHEDAAHVERAFPFQTASTNAELLASYNFPNPFIDTTRFYYTLNGSVQSARVSVFTLRGRKILTLDGPSFRGDNFVEWDGRDQDGDPVANGVYFYKLEVRTLEGRRIEKVDRVARVR